MSTTDPEPAGDGAHPGSEFREDDKLGPLGRRRSSLHDPRELREKLIGAFEQAVADAKRAVVDVDHGSAAAVHDARKSLRRARAVLSMISGALPKSERRAVRRALQEARRSLSTVRDHAVAPETLGALTLGDDERDTAKRVLDNAAEAIPANSEIKQLLAEAATRAAAQAEALQAALPPELAWSTVRDGIAEVYGDARRARRLAKHSKQWFHTWRRRSKELVYQLDLISEHAGARTLAIRAELDSITDALGPAVDLIMLREFVDTHAAAIGGGDIDDLQGELDDQLDALMKDTRKAAGDAFEQKAKKFGRRLDKAVRRDLTPADDNGGAAPDEAEDE